MKDNIQSEVFQPTVVLEIYDMMQSIGATYKFTDEELKAKIYLFQTNHKNCVDCKHMDVFFKKIFVQNTFQRLKHKVPQNKLNQIMNPQKSKVQAQLQIMAERLIQKELTKDEAIDTSQTLQEKQFI